MKSKPMCATLLIVSLLLASCNGMPFQRAAPSCQLAPPDSSLTAVSSNCPKEMSPQLATSQGGALLLNHAEARSTYDVCVKYYEAAVRWIEEAVARCSKISK